MFVGVGASRVRDMFEQAKKNALVSSLLTRLMLSVVIAAQAWAVVMMNVNKL